MNDDLSDRRYKYVKDENGKTRLQHRVVMEQKLGRPLRDDEVVHHINDVTKDNRPENLALLNASTHAALHRENDVMDTTTFQCAYCGKDVIRQTSQVRTDLSRSYCDKKCAGKHKYQRGIKPPKNNGRINGYTHTEVDNIIISDVKSGLNGPAIAKKYNWNRKTVYSHMKLLAANGLIQDVRSKYRKGIDEVIIKELTNGLTGSEIAKKYGYGKTTVYRHIDSLNLDNIVP